MPVYYPKGGEDALFGPEVKDRAAIITTLNNMPQPLLVRLPSENPIGQLTISKIMGDKAITLRMLISVRYSLRVALSKGV